MTARSGGWRTTSRIASGAIVLSACIGAYACSDGGPTQPQLADISVTIATATLQVGENASAAAILRDASGARIQGVPVTWLSSNASVASVNSAGVVTALLPGSAQITAASQGVSGSAAVTVVPVPVARVDVTLAATTLIVGTSTQAAVVTRDASGGVLTGRVVTWASDNANVATVDADGVVRAVGTGSVTISAASEGKSGSVALGVVPVPVASVRVTIAPASISAVESAQASAAVLDSAGHELAGRNVTWSSSDTTVATIASSGAIAGVGPGTIQVSAVSEGRTGTASLTITPAPVASVNVALGSNVLLVGQHTQASAVLRDARGKSLANRQITWSSSDASVATVSAEGLIVAVGAGSAAITATSESRSAAATLTVRPVPVATIDIALESSSVISGTSTQATATLRDSAGGVLTARAIDWTSANPAVATVSASGVVTAVAVGSTSINAASEGKKGSSALTVLPIPVAAVSVSLAEGSVTAVGATQATATMHGAHGELLSGREVRWSSGDASIATVSPTGAVTAVSAGSVPIVATSEGQTGAASLTVTPAPVATVILALAPASVWAGQPSQGSVILRDARERTLVGRVVTWSSGNTSVATVSDAGVITTSNAGTAEITATSEGQRATATITVTPAPVATVSVALAASTITAVGATQATAMLHDPNGNVLSARTVAWTSSDASVASIAPDGAIAALVPGTTTITAASEGKAGSATLTVTPAPVATVDVTLVPTSVMAGQPSQASAILHDARGRALIGRALAWTSSVVSVATVTPTGAVITLGTGTAVISAMSEGQSGSATLTVLPVPVAGVAVSVAPSTTIIAGQTAQASAVVLDSANNPLSGRIVAWTSDNTAVASVNATGMITAIAPGTANLKATSEGHQGSAIITVIPVPIASVQVSLDAGSITAVGTTQATASLHGAHGEVLTGRDVAWSSGDASIATVSPTGVVTAVSAGNVPIVATSEGQTGSAGLTVTPAPVATVTLALTPGSVWAGQTSQASVTLRDARARPLSGRAVSWTSSNTAVASVAADGLVTTSSAGSADITASSEGQHGAATITVTPAPVDTVSVVLASSSVSAVEATQATAILRDANGHVLSARAITWTSSDAAVATVSPDGAITALTEGTTIIAATSEGRSGSATLTVTPAPVATASVTVSPASVTVGLPSEAIATLRDARGRVLAGRTVTWTSDAAVAIVSASGAISTVGAGTSTITATSEGKSGSATLTVTPVPVASVTVAIAPAIIMVGQAAHATAATLDAASVPLSGRAVEWTSDNPAVATVSAAGVITAVGPGTAHVVATSEGHQGSVPLTVIPVPVASVSVTLAQSTVIAGQSTQASGLARDSVGGVLAGRTFEWTTGDAAIATVSPEGVVTGVAPGVTTVSATSEGKAGSVSVTIVPVPVATVAVSLTLNSVVEGQATQATATTSDAAGRVLTDRPVTWTSDNPAVATVSPAGVITTIVPGTAHIEATSEGIIGRALLTVIPIPVAQVTVSFGVEPLVEGFSTQASARVLDVAGNQLVNRTVIWSSDNPNVASVSAAGVVTAHFHGVAEIAATVDGVTGSRSLTITPAPVAAVSVSLSSTLLETGQTTGASVVLHDALGNVLTERVITWSSDNDAVATVSPTGVVTATGAGLAHIIVTSEGQSGSARLTVLVRTPSAEPAGLAPITQRSFDAVEEDGWTTTAASLPFYTITSDPTAPRSPSSVGQIRYPAGWLGGDSPGLTGRDIGASATTIYLSMWVKLSPNWVGHPTGTNKIIHLWIAHINRVYLVADGSDANMLTPRIGLQRIAGSYDNGFGTIGDALDLRPNLPGQLDAQIIRGQWHHWELVLTSNTDGLPNGSVDWWLDGVQVGHYTGIPFVDATETRTWDFIGFDPTWGGRDGMLDAEQSIYMDHIYVSGKP